MQELLQQRHELLPLGRSQSFDKARVCIAVSTFHLSPNLHAGCGGMQLAGAEFGFIRSALHKPHSHQRVHQLRHVRGLHPQFFRDGAWPHPRIGRDQRKNREASWCDPEACEIAMELVEGAQLSEPDEECRAVRERRDEGAILLYGERATERRGSDARWHRHSRGVSRNGRYRKQEKNVLTFQ